MRGLHSSDWIVSDITYNFARIIRSTNQRFKKWIFIFYIFGIKHIAKITFYLVKPITAHAPASYAWVVLIANCVLLKSQIEVQRSYTSWQRKNMISYDECYPTMKSMVTKNVCAVQAPKKIKKVVVEMMGFEPTTPTLRTWCSPNWATSPQTTFKLTKTTLKHPNDKHSDD